MRIYIISLVLLCSFIQIWMWSWFSWIIAFSCACREERSWYLQMAAITRLNPNLQVTIWFSVKPNVQCIKQEIVSFSSIGSSIISCDAILPSNNDELVLIRQTFRVSRFSCPIKSLSFDQFLFPSFSFLHSRVGVMILASVIFFFTSSVWALN